MVGTLAGQGVFLAGTAVFLPLEYEGLFNVMEGLPCHGGVIIHMVAEYILVSTADAGSDMQVAGYMGGKTAGIGMVAHVAAARGSHKGLQAGRKGRKKGFCSNFGGICQLHFHQLIVNLLDGGGGAVVFHEGRLRMVDHGKNCRFQAAVMNGIDLADNVLKGTLDQGRVFGRFFCCRQGGKGAGSDFQSLSGFLGSRGLEGKMEKKGTGGAAGCQLQKSPSGNRFLHHGFTH